MTRLALAWLAWLPFAAAAAADVPAPASFDQALAEAKARHAPLFIDFHAPWCHSCFFMEKHVMNGPEWEAVRKKALTIEVDSDSPEGSTVARKFGIKGWPTYVVLDENGQELGRILGDRTREAFYRELHPLLDNGAVLDQWKARAISGSADSHVAARTVLGAYYQRTDYAGALAWIGQLPHPTWQNLLADGKVRDLSDRLALLGAAERHDAPACIATAPLVLGGTLDCENLFEMSEFQACLDRLPEPERMRQLAPFKPRMAALQKDVLVDRKGTCSDTRGIVETAAQFYSELGDAAAAEQAFRLGIAYSEAGLAGDLTRDHHLADNLRYYLDRIGDNAKLDALFPKLIAAYPETYDYYLRYGKNLAKRGEYAKALTVLEQAAPKSYGRNRLWVAQWRAWSLLKLKRETDAKQVASEAMQANGPWFQDEILVLRGTFKGKAPG